MTNQVTIEIETSPGVWTNITSDVRQSSGVSISRGRSDEQPQAGPQRLSFTLNNRDGKYSPRNPLSTLFGVIGRNTPVRCKIDNSAFTRFYGEISAWPPRWNENHADNFVQIEAYGLLRRLGQGQPTVSNALRDWVLAQSTLFAYYPLSGGEETIYSQNIAPGKSGSFIGSTNAVFKYGVDMGAAWLGTGLEINATGDIPYMQGTGNAIGTTVALDFVFQSLAMGVLDVQIWPNLDEIWQLRLNTSGDAGTTQVSWNDGNGGVTTSTATAAVAALQDTELHTCRFELRQVAGPTVEWYTYIDGELIETSTMGLTQNLTRCPIFRFHYSRFVNQTYVNVAHLALWADNTAANIPDVQDFHDAAMAYSGETAIDRITRVATDGNISIITVGTAAESMPMGPQFTETRLEQIRDVESTDMGILFETRNAPGLTYLSRASLYNQTAAFTLDYAAGQVFPPLEPVDDDQVTRNDVTATRRDGGSDRYTVDEGPLSTEDPPDGVGRYETSVTVNPETDGFLQGIAAWVANIGTLDRARWPSVTVNLNSPNISSGLADTIKDAEIGQRFVITNMDEAFVYDDVSLIIVGYSETITPFIHTITFNCMPAEPYTVAVYDTARYDADGSTLTSNITSTATSLSATKSGTTLWTTDGTQMPFDIRVGGERLRVTAVSGSSSPQTLTVTRSINQVVKAHTAGTAIELWDTPRYAL
ncbi:hypothetical protein [Kribbella sp. NPDC050470]|uniref:hypothetical protein n=1 Tax=unclassified Kribbella TaxID=2644121 RepID=UPI003793D959